VRSWTTAYRNEVHRRGQKAKPYWIAKKVVLRGQQAAARERQASRDQNSEAIEMASVVRADEKWARRCRQCPADFQVAIVCQKKFAKMFKRNAVEQLGRRPARVRQSSELCFTGQAILDQPKSPAWRSCCRTGMPRCRDAQTDATSRRTSLAAGILPSPSRANNWPVAVLSISGIRPVK